MTDLGRWMQDNDWDDARLADTLAVDRSQASRLRRGKSFASPDTAKRLERLTKIAWHRFIRAAGAGLT